MDFSLFQELVHKYAPYLDFLSLAGGLGEPLLYPRLQEAALMARGLNERCIISISTNALLSRTVSIMSGLADVISFAQVSIDGVGATFDQIVGAPRSFGRFEANARGLLETLDGTTTSIRFNSVIHHGNLDQVMPIVRNIANWGGRRIYFNTFNLVSTSREETEYDLYYSEDYTKLMDETVVEGPLRKYVR